MVFTTDRGVNDKVITEEFYKLLHSVLKTFKTNRIPTKLYSDDNHNKEIYYSFEPVAIETTKMIDNQIQKLGVYDEERNLNIGIILFSVVLKFLNVTIDDMKKNLNYLIQRNILSQAEQMKTKNRYDLAVLRNRKLQVQNVFYYRNKDIFLSMVKKGLSLSSSDIENANKEYGVVINELNTFLSTLVTNTPALILANNLTHQILVHDCQISESDKALLFILTFEQLSTVLNFDLSQKSLSMYIMIASIKDLEKLTVNAQVNIA